MVIKVIPCERANKGLPNSKIKFASKYFFEIFENYFHTKSLKFCIQKLKTKNKAKFQNSETQFWRRLLALSYDIFHNHGLNSAC